MRSNDDKDMAVKRQRALYRACYRGTREMDFLLGHYARAKINQMDRSDLEAFERLMEFPEPVLASALIDGTGEFENLTASLIEDIRRFHRDKD